MIDNTRRARVAPALVYRDPKAAFLWLEQAFGLQPLMVLLTPEGELAHSEMSFGDGIVMIGGAWNETTKSPASLGGANTQSVHLHLSEDVDGHCERARKAGAKILMEPATQFYGDRAYRALDLEGHVWTFSQTVENLTSEEWDKASGLTTRTRL